MNKIKRRDFDDEQLVDTELGGVWVKIGNEWDLYAADDGYCMGTAKANNFRIQQLKLRFALDNCKREIKKAFINDLRKVMEYFSRWTI